MSDPLKQLPNAMADTFNSLVSSVGDAFASATQGVRNLADGGIRALSQGLPLPPSGAGEVPNPINMANQAVRSFTQPITGAVDKVANSLAGQPDKRSADGKGKGHLSF